METFSALLATCAGTSPIPGEFPAQSPVTLSFDVFFDLRLNKRLRKQSRGWWYETLSRPLWRHCNEETAVNVIVHMQRFRNGSVSSQRNNMAWSYDTDQRDAHDNIIRIYDKQDFLGELVFG